MPNLFAHASLGSAPLQPAPGALRVGVKSWGVSRVSGPTRNCQIEPHPFGSHLSTGASLLPPMPYISGVSPIWEASIPESLSGFFQESQRLLVLSLSSPYSRVG